MTDHEKVQHILYVLTRIHPTHNVVSLQPEDIIAKCENSAELDFWYRKLLK